MRTDFRALVDSSFLMTWFGLSVPDLNELLEEGYLVGFDIGTGIRNRELRFLFASALYYAATQARCPLDTTAMIDHLVPDKADLTTGSFRRVLNCCPDLLHALVKRRLIKLAPGAKMQKGGKGIIPLDRASCLAFLTSRLL